MKFEIGHNHTFEIRRESLLVGLSSPISVLFLSDLHLSRFNYQIIKQIIDTIESEKPDLILMGGDYVDTKKGLAHFETILKSITYTHNSFAIAGNHDYFYGIDKIKQLITENNIHWLEKSSKTITVNKTSIHLSNATTVNKNADITICVNHNPQKIDNRCNKIVVAFAGHLHGGQVVLKETKKGLYPGRLFYKWNFLRKKIGNVVYLNSKGLGDTLPLRYNCKKDLIILSIN